MKVDDFIGDIQQYDQKMVDIFIKPQEHPIKTVEDNIIRIYYNRQWVDFKDGKVFIRFPDDLQKDLS